MAPRTATRPARENDFSDVGKVGRRTGVMLPQGRLDVNGMEEISGIFSSPRKPSPLRKSTSIADAYDDEGVQSTPRAMAGVENAAITPSQALSSRKPIPPPRSASPRKSGISGTARRSRTVDVFGQNKDQPSTPDQPEIAVTQPAPASTLLASAARRFSPEKTPLRTATRSRTSTVRSLRQDRLLVDDSVHESVENTQAPIEISEAPEDVPSPPNIDVSVDDYVLPAVGDDDNGQVSVAASLEEEDEDPPLPPPFDDEDADQTFEPEARIQSKSKEPMVANSRRKRKSDAQEHETDAEAISSPAAKRAKRISDQTARNKRRDKSPISIPVERTAPRPRGRPPLQNKDTNTKMSSKQQEELDKIVERVRTRPGQKKSLYVLRRETPAEDGVTHTRSGRISVKPLAYWRNEKCVFGGSPGGIALQDGARFPLNSIKEIIRTEEVEAKSKKKLKKGSRSKGKNVQRSQSATVDAEDDYDNSEQEEAGDSDDPDAEPWETERGTFRGPVAIWDPEQQTPIDEEETMDIAYAAASIETREVKGSTFRYAKMLSMKFFGCGIVDLPSGGVKKAKNSRRMHMSFFVASGRVTVLVGALGGAENRFSIGTGGWWQVPRGNQYSIENELQKPARIFFSQACEPVPQGEDV